MAAEETRRAPPLLRRNTVFAFATQISTAAFTAVLTLVLLRLLGTKGYGEFAVAVAVGGLVLLPADFGLSGSTARYLAESRDDETETRRVLAAGFRLKLLVTVAVCLALLGTAGPIADAYHDAALVWPIRGVALALLGQGMMRFCLGCFSARERNRLSLVVVTGESFAELVASLALVTLGGGVAGATWGRAIGYGVGGVLGLIVLGRLFRVTPLRLLAKTRAGTGRKIARYAAALGFVDSVWSAFNQVDVLLIGAILSATAAGIFQAPLRLLIVASYPGIALGAAVGPRLARSEPGERPDPRALVKAARVLILVQAFAAGVVVAWHQPLTQLVLGSGYARSATVLAALTPYLLLSGLAPLFSSAIDYVGGTRLRARVGVVALVLNIVLDAALLPTVGVVGAAIGTDVGYAVYVAGHVAVGAYLLHFPLRALALSLGRSVLAGAGMAGVFVACSRLGVGGTAASALLGPATFAVLLVLCGETRGLRLRRLAAAARGYTAVSQ